jgi:CRISPR-associated protein Csc3
MQPLLEQVHSGDQVTRSFIQDILPALFMRNTGIAVKEEVLLLQSTSGKLDLLGSAGEHSLLGRQLNGIFPAMRLLNLMEEEQEGGILVPDIERRIFVLSALLSPTDEVGLMALTSVWDRAAIEQAKITLGDHLCQCNGALFWPDFATYLEDIAFLALVTRVQETMLRRGEWHFHLPEQRILFLHRLCMYATLLANGVRSPHAIQSSPAAHALSTALAELSGGKLEFCYHQLRQVRGVLSSAINNGVHRLLVESGGIWPYLFFPDGTIYIKRTSLAMRPSPERMAEAVKAELRDLCAERIRADGAGFKFSNQARAKHPDFYFEFLSINEYTDLLARFTVLSTRNDISPKPLATLRQMQEAGEIDADLPMDFLPDLRIGMFARFLSVVFNNVLGLLDRECAGLREDTERLVVSHLGLGSYWEKSASIPHKGGFDYRWFWLGACYLRDHPTISIDGEQKESLSWIFHSTMHLVCKVAGDELGKQMPQRYLTHLERYLSSVVELSAGLGGSAGKLPDFYAELERFTRSKARGGELVCTVCNGAFVTMEQRDSSVLFQPWVYKNKLLLYANKNVGGICVICELELMLRQILPKRPVRRTGSKFEELRVKYLSVYPDPFFTLETGGMIHALIDHLKEVNFFAIQRKLGGKLLDRTDLLALESVTAPVKETGTPREASSSPEKEEMEGDEVAADEGETTIPAHMNAKDWQYFKYLLGGQTGYFIFGMQAGLDDDEAAAWALPAFLALVLPLVTHTKLVLSESPLPLFHSGNAFAESVILDAPASYLDRILKGGGIAAHEVFEKLRLLTSIYLVNLDVYAKNGKPGWDHLSGIAQDLETDPARLFHYLLVQKRGESLYVGDAARYLHTYELMEAQMNRIKQTVENYVRFYRGGMTSNSITAPVDRIAEAIIKSPSNIDQEELLLQLQGLLSDWLERVRGNRAEGYALLWGKKRTEQEPALIAQFVTDFYQNVFLDSCMGERNQLQRILNTFRTGCEVYYKQLRPVWQAEKQRQKEREQQTEAEAASASE